MSPYTTRRQGLTSGAATPSAGASWSRCRTTGRETSSGAAPTTPPASTPTGPKRATGSATISTLSSWCACSTPTSASTVTTPPGRADTSHHTLSGNCRPGRSKMTQFLLLSWICTGSGAGGSKSAPTRSSSCAGR